MTDRPPPTAAPSSRAPPPPPPCSRPARRSRRAAATATARRSRRAVDAGFEESVAPDPAMDRAADHRRRAAQHRGGRRPYGAARDRGRLHRRAQGADRRRPGRVRHARRRRAAHRRHLFHVRRQAIRPGRMGVAAARGRGSSITRSAGRSAAAARSTRRGRKAPSSPRCTPSRRRTGGCRSISCCSPRARRRSARPISINVFDDAEVLAAMRRASGVIIPSASQSANGAVDDQPRRQGDHRMRADLVGRALGQGPGARHPFQPQGAGRQPGLAPRRGAADPGHRPWQPAGDRRLVRACPAADGARAGADRRIGAQPQRGGGEARARRAALDRRSALARIAGAARPRSRRSISRGWSPAIPGRAARPCCRRARVAKLDLRLVPNMTVADCAAQAARASRRARLRRHRGQHVGRLRPDRDRRGQPRWSAPSRRCSPASNIPYSLYPRSAGSWPGFVFTGEPLAGSAPASSASAMAAAPTRPTNIFIDRKPQPARRRPQGSVDGLCRLPLRDGDDPLGDSATIWSGAARPGRGAGADEGLDRGGGIEARMSVSPDISPASRRAT